RLLPCNRGPSKLGTRTITERDCMDTQGSWTLSALHEGTIFSAPREPHSSSLARTIIVVGAGFSGTALPIHLLRLPHAEPLRIVLVERGQVAGGVAYSERDNPYLLNVPAGRMSLSSDEPLHFLVYARRSLPKATAEDFLPRELYGQYLEASLSSA